MGQYNVVSSWQKPLDELEMAENFRLRNRIQVAINVVG